MTLLYTLKRGTKNRFQKSRLINIYANKKYFGF